MSRNLVETLEWLAERRAAVEHDPIDAECQERVEHCVKIQSWNAWNPPPAGRRHETRKD